MYFLFGHPLLVGNSNDNQIKNSLKYEMGYTPKEFKKTLQGLFISQTPYSFENFSTQMWKITIEDESTTVNINIEEAPPRIIALLTLPVLNVSFEFQESNEEQQQVFMNTFFRYFHKGGG